MRFFIPELERALKVIAVVALIGAIALPVGWGYEQRQRARAWRETACAYRLREVARATNSLVGSDPRGGACAVVRQLGLDVERGRLTAAGLSD